MKTNDMPPSVETLFAKHSKARVINPSRKKFITPHGDFSRLMTTAYAMNAHAKKYAHNR